MKKVIIGICIVVIVGLAIFFGLKSRDSSDTSNNPQTDVVSETNLEQLKSSYSTMDNFDMVEIGDSLSELESKLEVSLESLDDTTYTFYDESTSLKYIFIFEDQKLADVSILIVN